MPPAAKRAKAAGNASAPPKQDKLHRKISKLRNMVARCERKDGKDDPLAFQTPFRAQVVGGTGSGKTFWVIVYLLTFVQFDQIIWVTSGHSLKQKKFKHLKKKYGDYLVFVTGADFKRVEEAITHGESQKWRQVVVLDDMIGESGKNPYITEMFVAFRHRNVSVIELLQAIFPPGARMQRLQCDYFVLFKFAAIDEANRLFHQIAGHQGAKALNKAYGRILNRDPHGCIIIDLKGHSTPDNPLRVRDTDVDNLIPSLWNVTNPAATAK